MCFKNNDFSNLEIKNIKGKEIYIVDTHNCVFPIWIHKYRKDNTIYSLVTFDYHTDTNPAFWSYSFQKYIDISDNNIHTLRGNFRKNLIKEISSSSLDEIINTVQNKLKNDEHIKLAYELRIINEFHVINCSNEYDDENGYYYKNNTQCDNCENRLSCTNECSKEQRKYMNSRVSDKYILDMNFKIPSKQFILDFDLDYFNSITSLEPEDKNVISDLIKNCEFITIAREEHYFDKLKEEDFTVKDAENKLINLIESVL